MNSQLPPNGNEKIEALYQARKKRHLAPVADKTAIIERAHHNKPRSFFGNIADALGTHLKLSAVYATLAIAAVVIGLQSMRHDRPPLLNEPLTIRYTTVERHSMDTETIDEGFKQQLAATRPASKLFQYNRRRHEILIEQAKNIQNQQLLRVISQDSGLALVNCDDELIEISNQALAMLVTDNSSLASSSALSAARSAELSSEHASSSLPSSELSNRFKQGELLALTFDANGYIVAIQRSAKTQQCI